VTRLGSCEQHAAERPGACRHVEVRFADAVLERERLSRTHQEIAEVALGGAAGLAAAEIALAEDYAVEVAGTSDDLDEQLQTASLTTWRDKRPVKKRGTHKP